jgi:tetratricopeptide (TPR) repeat protein
MPRANPEKDKIYAELVIAGLLTYSNWLTDRVNRPVIKDFIENVDWWSLKDGNGFQFKASPDVIINVINVCSEIGDFRKLENKNLTAFTTCSSLDLYDNIRDSLSTLHKYNLIKQKEVKRKIRNFVIYLPNKITDTNHLKRYLQELFGEGNAWDKAANDYRKKTKLEKINAVESKISDPNLAIIKTDISQAMIQVAHKLPPELTAYTLECRTFLTPILPGLEQALTLPSLVSPQDYAKLLLSSARIYVANGDYKRAKYLLEKFLDSDTKSTTIADIKHLLGNIYFQEGKYSDAKKYYFLAYQQRIEILGEKNTDVGKSSEAIARLYNSWGIFEKAEEWYKITLDIQKAIHGNNHILYAHALNGLANLYIKTFRFDKAESLYKDAIDILTKQPDNYPYLTDSQHGLANLYIRQKKYQEAEILHKSAIDSIESKEGSDHHRLVTHRASLAVLYCFKGQIKLAINLYRKCIKQLITTYGKEYPQVGAYRSDLAWILSKNTNYQRRAFVLFRSSVAILSKTCTVNHPSLMNAQKGLNLLASQEGKFRNKGQFITST